MSWQLASSLWFSAISLIPHHASRYILLGFSAVFVVASATYYQHPSAQLQNLEELIQQTEDTLREAHSEFPLNFRVSLAGQGIRLLKEKRTASTIRCRLLETHLSMFTLTRYFIISGDIRRCAREVKHIRTVVEFLFETERQRYYTADINETETMLADFQVGRTGDFSAPRGYCFALIRRSIIFLKLD
ncbi:hypothetical protein FB45DRAFT_947068 [Roridomyces roridus]|uniref:Uncharacterized protein n=1 Tax=Roridomyces roridus TaxID=1738132 RepID=A0AAD7B202_9AGAR|nr:hypothetical protein FB45DRAFT_947068 [Roridomyces roridus]